MWLSESITTRFTHFLPPLLETLQSPRLWHPHLSAPPEPSRLFSCFCSPFCLSFCSPWCFHPCPNPPIPNFPLIWPPLTSHFTALSRCISIICSHVFSSNINLWVWGLALCLIYPYIPGPFHSEHSTRTVEARLLPGTRPWGSHTKKLQLGLHSSIIILLVLSSQPTHFPPKALISPLLSCSAYYCASYLD